MGVEHNLRVGAAQLRDSGPAVVGAVHREVVRWGAILQTRIRANASGRPGPNAITGDYRRSITRESTRLVGESFVIVGTNKPQARRLELGFVGRDRIGRTYNQRPFPHFAPALESVREGFVEGIAKAANEALR